MNAATKVNAISPAAVCGTQNNDLEENYKYGSCCVFLLADLKKDIFLSRSLKQSHSMEGEKPTPTFTHKTTISLARLVFSLFSSGRKSSLEWRQNGNPFYISFLQSLACAKCTMLPLPPTSSPSPSHHREWMQYINVFVFVLLLLFLCRLPRTFTLLHSSLLQQQHQSFIILELKVKTSTPTHFIMNERMSVWPKAWLKSTKDFGTNEYHWKMVEWWAANGWLGCCAQHNAPAL